MAESVEEPLERVVDLSRRKRRALPPVRVVATAPPPDPPQPQVRDKAPGPMLEGDLCHVCRLKGRKKVSASYCMTCDMQMCKVCTDQHRSTKISADHQIVSKQRAMNVPTCTIHRFSPIKYYCDSCGEFVCINCTMIEHKDHNIVDVRDKIRKSKKFLQSAVETLDNKLATINTEMKKIKDLEVNIEQARRKMKVKVNEQVNHLAQQLKSQHEKMTIELDGHFDGYLDSINDRKDDLKVDFNQINALRRTVEQDLSNGSDDKLVLDAMKLENQVRDAVSFDIKPTEFSDFKAMEFVMTNNAVLGTFEMTNEPVVSAHKLFTDPRERGSIIINKLWTRLKMIYRYKTTAFLKEPSGIAILPTGRYVVSDYSNHGLLICDKTGRFQQRVLLLEVARPNGVAVTKNGEIAVTSDRWIKTFKATGLLGQLGQYSIYPSPGSFTIDDQGRYIISDSRTRNICIYETSGKLLSKFDVSDKSGSAPDMFNISVHGGHIALSYQHGTTYYIRVYGYDGTIIHSTKVPHQVLGLVVDRTGNILVATVDGVYIVPAGGRVMPPLIILEKNGRNFQLNPRLLGLTPEGNILCVHQNTNANRSEIVLLQPLIAEHRLRGHSE